MVANEPGHDLAGFAVETHAANDPISRLLADFRMIAGHAFREVVQQRAEQQQLRSAAGTRDDGVDIDLATGRVAHLAGIEKARALCDRFEQMTIDGVAVVRVALRPRSNVFPFGQEPDEHAFMVERLEYRNRVRSRTEETNEARALPHVPGRL